MRNPSSTLFLFLRLNSPVRVLALLLAGFLVPVPGTLAEEKPRVIEPQEPWSSVFGGEKVEFHFDVKPVQALTGRAEWNFSAGANRATVATGEAAVTAAPDKPAQVDVSLRIPEVKAGVVVRAQLRLWVYGQGAGKPEATLEKPVWIFPRDPFALRKEWLKKLNIKLFDPAKTTAGPLTKMDIPFEEIDNDAAIGGLKEGLLLIGEGVSFKDYPALSRTLVKTAAGGVSVLCLAPVNGTLPIPGADRSPWPLPKSLSFRRQDLITELDKRLDAAAWPPQGQVVAAVVTLKADENLVVGEVAKGANGWPWVEADFPDHNSKLVVCGFGLFGKAWEAGPTPRFLLAQILERVTQKSDDQTLPKETDR